jgi:hypothetical protein
MNGATVFELHKSWGFSTSVLDLLTAGKAFNFIALAALTAKLALLDSVLLQQAAGENPGLGDRAGALVRVPIVPTIPNSYTGVWSDDGFVGQFSRDFSASLYGYSTFGDLISPDYSDSAVNEAGGFNTLCDGDCFAQVEGFGWDISCATANNNFITYNVTKEMALNTTQAWENSDTVNVNKTLYHILSVSASQQLVGVDYGARDYSYVQLNTSWAEFKPAYGGADNKDAVNCTGRILKQICEFRPARVLYPVEVINQKQDSSPATSNGFRIADPWWVDPNIAENTQDTFAGSSGVLKNNQIKGVKVLEVLPYDPDFDLNIQSFASTVQSMFGGDVWLEYLEGTGYMAVPDGAAAIGTWWTPITTIM